LVKPAIYLAALGRPAQYHLLSPLQDAPIQMKSGARTWSPQNYDRRVHGEVALYRALAQSYNLSTVRLGLDLGLPRVIETLKALGVERPIQPYPSLLLGALDLSPLEVAQVYQTFAAGGYRAPPRAIREVLDPDGRRLQRYPLRMERAAPAGPVYLTNWAMQRVVSEGTARGLSKYLPATLGIAGKTGTTDELRDSWFAGFSADKVLVVWAGRDDNLPTKLSGASGALQVWGAIMSRLAPRAYAPPLPATVEVRRLDPAGAGGVPFIKGAGPAPAPSATPEPSSILDLFQ
jgi:penicillin-binding protein 1B